MRVDPPEDIDDLADLTAFLADLAEAHNQLVAEVERIDSNVTGQFEQLGALKGGVRDVREAVERIDEHVELVEGTMPDQQKGKIEKIMQILDYAVNEATRGPGGVKVTTGEATAAAGSSRDTARRLMDEIGATFRWAEVETPGGPVPKELRLSIADHDLRELKTAVREHYTTDVEGSA